MKILFIGFLVALCGSSVFGAEKKASNRKVAAAAEVFTLNQKQDKAQVMSGTISVTTSSDGKTVTLAGSTFNVVRSNHPSCQFESITLNAVGASSFFSDDSIDAKYVASNNAWVIIDKNGAESACGNGAFLDGTYSK